MRTQVIKPRRLSPADRETLADTLYQVHRRIFSGLDRQHFVQQLIESPARDTSILLHRNRLDEVVGYCAVHLYEHLLDGQWIGIIRSQAALLPAYRGHNRSMPFALRRALGYRLRVWHRPLFFFGTLIHPASYLLCRRYIPGVWPAEDKALSGFEAAILKSCVHKFDLPLVDPANPLVVDIGWRPRQDKTDTHFWRHNDDPEVQFFMRHNPEFGKGHGLITLFPLSLTGVARGLGRLLSHQIRRTVAHWRNRVQLA